MERTDEHRDQEKAKEEGGAPARSAALGRDKSSENAADAGDSFKKKRGKPCALSRYVVRSVPCRPAA